MKAELRPLMFSSPVPGTDSHLSFPIISPGFGGRQRQRQKETQLPPAVPGWVPREARGKPGADVFLPLQLHPGSRWPGMHRWSQKHHRHPRVGVPLGAGASLLSNWAEISNPARSTEHSTRPGSFPQAGWVTGKVPASVRVKPEWFLIYTHPPTHAFPKWP